MSFIVRYVDVNGRVKPKRFLTKIADLGRQYGSKDEAIEFDSRIEAIHYADRVAAVIENKEPTAYSQLPAIERSIINRLIANGLANGYLISVNDGEVWTLRDSTKAGAIKAEIGHTDDCSLAFRKKDGKFATFYLVHGNQEDLISDCTENDSAKLIEQGVEDIINKA